MLNDISKGLHARIELNKKDEEEQKLLVERHQREIDILTEECKQVFLRINIIKISMLLSIYVIELNNRREKKIRSVYNTQISII